MKVHWPKHELTEAHEIVKRSQIESGREISYVKLKTNLTVGMKFVFKDTKIPVEWN